MTTDTIEAPADMAPTLADSPIHLARCPECDFAVRYQPSATGASFLLIDSDQGLGIGEHGRPICPNGHGEMEIADDRLPIEQAIEQTAERLNAAVQRDLPGIVPVFN